MPQPKPEIVRVPPQAYRWLGRALAHGYVPLDGRNEYRLDVLRRLLELSPDAGILEMAVALERFKKDGPQRRGC